MNSARIGDLVRVGTQAGFYVVAQPPEMGTQVSLHGISWVARIPEFNGKSIVAALDDLNLVSEWEHSRIIPSALWVNSVPVQEPWADNREEICRKIKILLRAYPEAQIVVPAGVSPLVTPVVLVSQNGWIRVCVSDSEIQSAGQDGPENETAAESSGDQYFHLTAERAALTASDRIRRRVNEVLEDGNMQVSLYAKVVYELLNVDDVERDGLLGVTFPPRIPDAGRASWISAVEECLGFGLVPAGKPQWDVVLPPDVEFTWNLAASERLGALSFIGGSAGTGKTHALAKLTAESARNGRRVLVVTWTRPVQRMIRGIVRRWGGYRSDLVKILTVEELIPAATRSRAMSYRGVLEKFARTDGNIDWDAIATLRSNAAKLRLRKVPYSEREKHENQLLRDDRDLGGTQLSVLRMKEADQALGQSAELIRPFSDVSEQIQESPLDRMRKWYSVVVVLRLRVHANKNTRVRSVDPEAHLYPEVILIDEAQDLEGLDWFLIASLLLDIGAFNTDLQEGDERGELRTKAIAENILRIAKFSEVRAYFDDRQDTFGRGVGVTFPFGKIVSEGSRAVRKAISRGQIEARNGAGLSATNGSEAASIALGWLFDGLSGSSGASTVQRLQKAIKTELPRKPSTKNYMVLEYPLRFGPSIGALAAEVASNFKDLDKSGEPLTFAEELTRQRPLKADSGPESVSEWNASSDDNMFKLIAKAVYENWEHAIRGSREQTPDSPYQLRLPISIVTMSPRLAWVLSWLFATGFAGQVLPVQSTMLCRDFAEDFKIRGAREFSILERAAWVFRPPVNRNHKLDHWLYSEHKRRGLEGIAPLSPFLTISPITAFKGYETTTVIVVKEGRGKTPLGLYERRHYSAVTRASEKLIVIDASEPDQAAGGRKTNQIRESVERYWPIARRAVHGTSGPVYGAQLTRPWTIQEFQDIHELLARQQKNWAEDYKRQFAKYPLDLACKHCGYESRSILDGNAEF